MKDGAAAHETGRRARLLQIAIAGNVAPDDGHRLRPALEQWCRSAG